MARFYRTSSATPLDYMSKLNVPLMTKVIEANDNYITENLDRAMKLGEAATTFPFLQPDEGRAREISQEYSKKIDDITAAIQSDPANWRSQLNPIRDVTKNLQENYKVGEISKIVDNYSKYKKTSDYIDEQVKAYTKDGKGISAERGNAYKKAFLSNFISANPKGTAYDPTTGEYNSINVFDPMNNIDIRKTLSEELDKMKADGMIKITDELTGKGEYFNKQTEKWEGVTPEKILRIVTDRLNNPQLMDYLKQDSAIGLVTGVFDTNPASPNYGQFIEPYKYDKTPLTTTEQNLIDKMKAQVANTKNNNTKQHLQQQLDAYTKQLASRTNLNWNEQSYLAPIMRGVVDQFSYGRTEQGSELKNNSLYNTMFTQNKTDARHNQDLAQRERMQQKAFDNAEKLQNARLEAAKDLKLMDINNKLATGKAKVDPNAKTNKDNAVVGSLYTTPFYWTTEEKSKLTTSLNDEVNLNKNTLQQLEKALNNIRQTTPDNEILIANAENQIGSVKAKLSSLESQREAALGYAINQWRSKGVQPRKGLLAKAFGAENPVDYTEDNERIVRNYLSGTAKTNYDAANAEFLKVEAEKKRLENGDQAQYNQFLRQIYYPARNRKATTENMFLSGQRIFNSEVKPFTDDKLEKAAKETTIRNQLVNTTQEQDNRVIEMINADPSSYKIRDNTGKEVNLSFEHGTATTDPKKFRINGVAPTTGLGDKQIELGVTINGKNYVITPKDDGYRLNKYFAEEFKKSKDKEVQNIGSILASPTAGVISDMMTEMRLNTNPLFGTKDAWVYKLIPNPANPKETLKIRARSINTGGEPKWEFQAETSNPQLIINNPIKGTGYEVMPDGNLKGFVPLASTRSKDGVYNNLEDVLSIFPD